MSTITDLAGRIRDADSHEMIPAGLWPEVFGDVTAPFAQFFLANQDPNGKNSFSPPVERDDAPISADTLDSIWQSGCWSPGAIDMQRRLEVLDLIGVKEQIILSTGVGFMGMIMTVAEPKTIKDIFGLEIDPVVLQDVGWGLLKVTNDWAIETAKVSPRLRPTANIPTHDLKVTLDEAARVVSAGVKAIAIPGGTPPGGKSPAHPTVDPLWEMFVAEDVTVLFHFGNDFGFLRKPVWQDYEDVDLSFGKHNLSTETGECGLNPYAFAQANIASQNMLTAMIYGGVFDRFPTLRVGVLECSAYWVGPMAENMYNVGQRFPSKLELTPAEYLQRNVRVAPYWWEPVDKYIERFGLEDVYVFGSDYPHYEGGKDAVNLALSKLEKLGPTVVEKYFVENAELLFP